MNDMERNFAKEEEPSTVDIAAAQDQLNALHEAQGAEDTHKHGPIWHAIDGLVNVHANRKKVKVKRKAYLRCCIGGIFGIHRFYARQWVQGFLYLATCWTGFSAAMTIIDAMAVAPMKPDEDGMIEL